MTEQTRKALAKDHIPRKALADAVRARVKQLGLSRAAAALRVGDAASQMSRLMTGYDHEFSADRLVGFLAKLGVDVLVVVTPRATPKYTRPRVAYLPAKGRKERVTHGR